MIGRCFSPAPVGPHKPTNQREIDMTNGVHTANYETTNAEFVRRAYAIAEMKDIPGWVDCFTADGVFIDNSVAMTYRGPDELGKVVVNYGTAFSDMHRELYHVYASGDHVTVVLALQGTHDGPLWLPQGILPPTGQRMDAPCCDVFHLKDGKIQLFDCYPSGAVILGQLGALGNLDAVLQQHASV
jgi:ketosteroid isomerase-like protein